MRVKICGLTNLTDAQAAVDAGADLLGFIFYPHSPRYVTPEQVHDILTQLVVGSRVIQTVGVFVNQGCDWILQTVDYCGLELAQLHGEEPPEMLDELAFTFHKFDACGKVQGEGCAYKALRPRTAEEAFELAERYALPSHLTGSTMPAFLLDAYHPEQRGGSGRLADWNIAAQLARRYPLLLAGGLTPANVQAAVQTVSPWGVDVSSGVEVSPGKKDHTALRAFIENAKNLKG